MDTIYALATARGKAGVAVVRLSGPAAFDVASRLAGPLPSPRQASLRRLAWNGSVIDDALVLAFPEGASFTGEAVAELHLHGSLAVVDACLRALGDQPETRLAGPGEFTRRALDNGRMDLIQVEGLADLIDAETEAQRQQALRLLEGDVGRMLERWRGLLLRAKALIEASIDFSEEGLPDGLVDEVRRIVAGLRTDVEDQVEGVRAAERIRDGFEVAIVGAPNVGKSTLLNAIVGRSAALTSPYPGTTRDVIEVRLDIEGLPVTVMDMAGLRATDDPVERMGVDLARRRAERADLRIFLGETDLANGLGVRPDDIRISAKSDLSGDPHGISGTTGAGVDRLVSTIGHRLCQMTASSGSLARERHRLAMTRVVGHLQQCEGILLEDGAPIEYCAESLRHAMDCLEFLQGRVSNEEILGEVFAKFCIGK